MIRDRIESNLYWLFILMFITIPLFPRGISWLPSLAFVLGMLFLAIDFKRIMADLIASQYIWAFLAFFIPGLISLIDSLDTGLTLQTLWRFLRYSGFGLLALIVVRYSKGNQRIDIAIFWFLIFVCLDAMAHWLFEFNIYGKNPLPGNSRVRGVFKKYYHLSYFVATLSPIILFHLVTKLREGVRAYWVITPIVLLLLILTVLVGGARAGFVTLFVSFILFIGLAMSKGWIRNKLRFCLIVLGLGLIVGGIVSQSTVIQDRFEKTTTVRKNQEFIDRFTSSRTNIWKVTLKEIPNYWINGVGLRGFDAVYQTYPKEYKIWSFVNHSHLHILEVQIETGIIGLIPYLILCGYLLFMSFRAREGNAWLLVSFLAIMPINSHAGLFEGHWLPMVWVPLALGLAKAYEGERKYRRSLSESL